VAPNAAMPPADRTQPRGWLIASWSRVLMSE
jgi:hypothetical protein